MIMLLLFNVLTVFTGAVALAVRQDSRGANSSHVVVPSENDPEKPEINVPSSDDPGSHHPPILTKIKTQDGQNASCCYETNAKTYSSRHAHDLKPLIQML